MILTATVCFLAGAVLGLKFNVKLLAHASILVIAVGAVFGLSGFATYTSAAADGLIGLFALQTGYFATVLLAVMGFVDQRGATSGTTVVEDEELQVGHLAQTQKLR